MRSNPFVSSAELLIFAKCFFEEHPVNVYCNVRAIKLKMPDCIVKSWFCGILQVIDVNCLVFYRNIFVYQFNDMVY